MEEEVAAAADKRGIALVHCKRLVPAVPGADVEADRARAQRRPGEGAVAFVYLAEDTLERAARAGSPHVGAKLVGQGSTAGAVDRVVVLGHLDVFGAREGLSISRGGRPCRTADERRASVLRVANMGEDEGRPFAPRGEAVQAGRRRHHREPGPAVKRNVDAVGERDIERIVDGIEKQAAGPGADSFRKAGYVVSSGNGRADHFLRGALRVRVALACPGQGGELSRWNVAKAEAWRDRFRNRRDHHNEEAEQATL